MGAWKMFPPRRGGGRGGDACSSPNPHPQESMRNWCFA